jgi:hypothetical protein
MSAGHSLRRENYTFPRFDPRLDRPVRAVADPNASRYPGPIAVIVTVAIAATFAFFSMDQSAATWLRNELLVVWHLVISLWQLATSLLPR